MTKDTENSFFWIKMIMAIIMFIATVSCSLLGWLALSVNALNTTVASMRTELDILNPMGLATSISGIQREQLTKAEVTEMFKEIYPAISDWHRDKPTWVTWKSDLEEDLEIVHNKLDRLLEK